jgi:HD-GYP domain-containing protein (c-di-GMP phosphodiesterase class II)
MGLKGEQLEHIKRGALLHDIGKIAIPDSILLKEGSLTQEEIATMRQHPVYAQLFMGEIEFLRPAMDIPVSHHEKWDGSGYPKGLRGEEIPLAARIFAVVDVWDALTSDRPYRKALIRDEALAYLQSESGRHFDPEVVKAFRRVVDLLR